MRTIVVFLQKSMALSLFFLSLPLRIPQLTHNSKTHIVGVTVRSRGQRATEVDWPSGLASLLDDALELSTNFEPSALRICVTSVLAVISTITLALAPAIVPATS